MLVITPTSGWAHAVSGAISPGALVPTSHTRYWSPRRAERIVSGTPTALLKLLGELRPRNVHASSWAMRRVVVVFPLDPPTATTFVVSSVRRYAPASCSRALPVSGTCSTLIAGRKAQAGTRSTIPSTAPAAPAWDR